MDPISALSVASSIIAIVDAAVKSGKNIYEVYNSLSGLSDKAQRIATATDGLQNAIAQLRQSSSQLTACQSQDPNVGRAATQCEQVIKSIKAILDDCKATKPESARSTAKAYVNLIKNKSDLKQLLSDLESATEKLKLSLAIATRDEIGRILNRLNLADKNQANLAGQLKALQVDLAGQLSALNAKLDQSNSVADQNWDLINAIRKAVTISDDSMKALNQAAILQGVRARIDQRYEKISEPCGGTFEWILEEDCRGEGEDAVSRREVATRLVEWLKSGAGAFHFIGKPGSGKSTLMKFLVVENRTLQLLHEWANQDQKRLILSKFFF
ncbi:hypothetical protein M011DRAFT_330937 [Sporormia fimetaria CBS 119925]|uniref:Azaphilone pigments biosynthesis cluster protein L N-terminal domain-containing protein n=1 Tax=Sporormia fimetaria CBS 119925 TaxID=1340428 RepID=A0A6A6UV80_9PLEO|nr:hypothetical protein M011DRAFT_330937 [Sporormia fimetaria CBS 119925]